MVTFGSAVPVADTQWQLFLWQSSQIGALLRLHLQGPSLPLVDFHCRHRLFQQLLMYPGLAPAGRSSKGFLDVRCRCHQ